MERVAAKRLVLDLYTHALGRSPAQLEYDNWVDVLVRTGDPAAIVRAFYESGEYKDKHRVQSVFPPGHYHSPVVDPTTVGSYFRRERNASSADIAGIEIDVQAMLDLWKENLEVLKQTPFTETQCSANRYFYQSGPYPYGDAITLRMMIGYLKPKRIIEIGSGASSACMLDSADHFGLAEMRLTCIEPFPNRLRSLLRAGDEEKIDILEKPIQAVPAEIVDDLEENDILFIDSTHVLKTGSDVHYEFFHLLPRIKPGVIVHFHDVQYPFEYPPEWVFDLNFSWNEAYALRAFLMYNAAFKITFWNSLLAKSFASEIQKEVPTFLKNPGGSIWIRRMER